MRDLTIDRRRLLVAAVAFAGSIDGLRLSRAWAQDADTRITPALVEMARRLYPHDALPDSLYAQILADALDATAADPAFAAMLTQAEDALNAQQAGDFADLDERDQIAALGALEQAAFFGSIQTAVRLRLYNHPALWALIGYEGPSWQFGGYLNRGAGDIDWLEERD